MAWSLLCVYAALLVSRTTAGETHPPSTEADPHAPAGKVDPVEADALDQRCSEGAEEGGRLDETGDLDGGAMLLHGLLADGCDKSADLQFALGNLHQRMAHAEFVLGNEEEKKSQLLRAAIHFGLARNLDPTDAASCFNLGGTLWQLGTLGLSNMDGTKSQIDNASNATSSDMPALASAAHLT